MRNMLPLKKKNIKHWADLYKGKNKNSLFLNFSVKTSSPLGEVDFMPPFPPQFYHSLPITHHPPFSLLICDSLIHVPPAVSLFSYSTPCITPLYPPKTVWLHIKPTLKNKKKWDYKYFLSDAMPSLWFLPPFCHTKIFNWDIFVNNSLSSGTPMSPSARDWADKAKYLLKKWIMWLSGYLKNQDKASLILINLFGAIRHWFPMIDTQLKDVFLPFAPALALA